MVSSQYHSHRLLLDKQANQLIHPAPNGTETAASLVYSGGNSEANFDSNMVIILAALLCALICALGLNSIVRCALRCSHRVSFETAEQAAIRLATTGLKQQTLNHIPVAVYAAELPIPATECVICLGDFVEGEKVRILPKCNHGFHVHCIDTWLVSHSSCPTCRQILCEYTSCFNVAGEVNVVRG